MKEENTAFEEYLKPTFFIDFDNEIVQEFVKKHSNPADSLKKQAIDLYYAVRDSIRYDPYCYNHSRESSKASNALMVKKAWCVPKATVYVACCRAIGIPARLGFADVKNHLSTARMREWMQSDVFSWHGYTLIYLNGKWIKTTPAFNIELCDKFGLKPLDFDGENESIYHAFDKEGRQHMEYVLDRGIFDDLPFTTMTKSLRELYPRLDEAVYMGDFEKDVVDEVTN